MLGLGNTLTAPTSLDDALQSLNDGVALLSITDNGDEDVNINLVFNRTTSAIDDLLSPSSPSAGDQITGVSLTLKVERYDNEIANGGTVQAQATEDVFAYFNGATGAFNAYFLSPVNSPSGLSISTFQTGGSSRFNLASFNSTDLTASDENLYVFTLTAQKSGYQDFVLVSSEITI